MNCGMPASQLIIYLANPAAKYLPGETVTGVVKLHLEQPKFVRGMLIYRF